MKQLSVYQKPKTWSPQMQTSKNNSHSCWMNEVLTPGFVFALLGFTAPPRGAHNKVTLLHSFFVVDFCKQKGYFLSFIHSFACAFDYDGVMLKTKSVFHMNNLDSKIGNSLTHQLVQKHKRVTTQNSKLIIFPLFSPLDSCFSRLLLCYLTNKQ